MRFLRRLRFALSLLVLLMLISACTLPLPTRLTVSAVKNGISIDDFTEQLTTALMQQDYAQLQSLMGSAFVVAAWRSEGREFPPPVAVVHLRNHYLNPGSAVVVPTAVKWDALLDGSDPLTLWGPMVQAVKAIYVTGLSANQQDEALLIVAQQPDGTLYWHSMLVAAGGFQSKLSPATTVITPDVATETATDESVAMLTETLTEALTEALTETLTMSAVVSMDTLPADAPLAQADPLPRFVFEHGAMSSAVRGVLLPQGQKVYRLRALEGQLLAVEVASPAGQATFTLSGVNDDQTQDNQIVDEPTAGGLANGVRVWRGTMPATQDYLITVTALSATPFELVATFDPRQAPAKPEPAPVRVVFAAGSTIATVAEQVAAPERHRYLVRGAAGQTLQVAMVSPADAASFAVQGVTDGKPLKRLEQEASSWSSELPLTQDYLITVATTGAMVEYAIELVIQ